MTTPDAELQRLRHRLHGKYRVGEITEADFEVIRDFDNTLTLLLGSEYGKHRVLKLLKHVFYMADGPGGLAASLDDRDAAETLVRWINENYTNEETNADFRRALRVFGRRVTDDGVRDDPEEPPESLAWIPSTTPSNYDPKPDPSEMLRWDPDVLAMIDEAHTSRDKAAIAVQFDAGLRGFEFRDLTVGDVSDGRHGLQVTVDGKQGQRTVTLFSGGPHLNRWLADHPAPDDGDAPLWSKLNRPERPSYRMLCKIFEKAAERAGVSKPVTLTNFRKSSASFLASRGVNQATLEDHHGWVRGSDAAARAIAGCSDATEREIGRAHGKEIDEADEPEPTAPIECRRCGRETPRDLDLCVWCGQATDPDAARRAETFDDLLAKSLAEAEGDEADRILELRKASRTNPELRAEAVDELAGILDDQH